MVMMKKKDIDDSDTKGERKLVGRKEQKKERRKKGRNEERRKGRKDTLMIRK